MAKPNVETKGLKDAKSVFRGAWMVFLLLAVVTFGAYVNSFQNGFLSDDLTSIVGSPWLADFGRVVVEKHDLGDIYRSFLYNIGGLNPFVYHLSNTLWHLGVSFLVYSVLLVIFERRGLAIVGSLLFALHPIHTEAVTWISGAPYILSSFWALASLLVVIMVEKELLRRSYVWAAAGLLIMAFWFSEKAVVVPLVMIWYLVLFGDWRKTIGKCWPLGVVWVIYGISLASPFFQRVADVSIDQSAGTPTVFNPLIQWPIEITSYLKLLFLPVGLTLYHESFVMTPLTFSYYIAGTLAFLAVVIWAIWKRIKWLAFAGGFFVLSLLVTMLPIQVSWLVAERYVYLGSFGFVAVVAYGLWWLYRKNQTVGVILVVAVLCTYFGLTVKRNFDWQSQDTLWPATVAVSPLSSLAHNNMGDYYSRHGDLQKAAEEFERARQLRPDYADATYNLGNTYMVMGEASKAAVFLNEALAINPKLIQAEVDLAGMDIMDKNFESAKEKIEKAQQISPDSAIVNNIWGVYYYDMGQRDKAVEMFRRALAADPGFTPAQNNLKQLGE